MRIHCNYTLYTVLTHAPPQTILMSGAKSVVEMNTGMTAMDFSTQGMTTSGIALLVHTVCTV
jgi:hypothetical protein